MKVIFAVRLALLIISSIFCSKGFAITASDSTITPDTIKRVTPSNGTKVFSQNFKTIKANIKGVPLSFPVINIKGEQAFEITFDELSSEFHNMSYKVIHCDVNWNPSKLLPMEYSKGFEIIPITTWKPSQNTAIDYVHYTFSFPNDDFMLLKSGNYLVQVFNDSNLSKPVFETRTVVVDQIVTIKAKAQRSSFVDNMDLKQEVNIDLNLNTLKVRDPYQDIKVVICQNGRWDNANKDMQPTFVNNNELSYPRNGSNTFDGGNEFRRFNTKTYKYITEHVRNFKFNGKTYEYELLTDEPRRYKEYEKNGDMNGNYYVLNDLGQDEDVSSEYVDVHFFLKYEAPEPLGNVHIFGALTNWEINDNSLMMYDSLKQGYTKTLLLKQGMYDYQYAYVDNISKTIDCSYEENTHQETENSYYIFVYFNDFNSNGQTVVGYFYTTQ